MARDPDAKHRRLAAIVFTALYALHGTLGVAPLAAPQVGLPLGVETGVEQVDAAVRAVARPAANRAIGQRGWNGHPGGRFSSRTAFATWARLLPTASATSANSRKAGCVTSGTVVSLRCAAVEAGTERVPVAVIDVAGFVADLKNHAAQSTPAAECFLKVGVDFMA